MNDFRTDDEQVEHIKKWLKENGASLATGILIGLTVLFGGKAWTEYKGRQIEQASNIYTQLASALAAGNEEVAIAAENKITGDFSSSPYAVLGQLQMARHVLDNGQLEAARAHLQWALDHASMPQLAHIVRLRLARLSLADGRIEDAEALIGVPEQGAFAGVYDEVRGDLDIAKGDNSAAVIAYDSALASLPPDSPVRNLIQIKRDNVHQGKPAAPE